MIIMKIYILSGKWATSRCGITEIIERRILYLPDKDLKFSVDDRSIRNLSSLEEDSLKYFMGSMTNDASTSWGSKHRNKLKLVKKEADENLVYKLIEAYNNQDRSFFFGLE